MADFMRIGTFVYNLAHVRQIYKEAPTLDPDTGQQTNDPDTWNVLYEMGIDPRSGTGIIQGQVFTGEEGRAVGFWVENNIPDTIDIYRRAQEPRPVRRTLREYAARLGEPDGDE